MPVLLLLFVGSGCAALIYEIVWFQLLRLTIGSTAVSLGVLLGTFMGGMCLGSVGLPHLVSPKWHPLRVYAFLELGIGASKIDIDAILDRLQRDDHQAVRESLQEVRFSSARALLLTYAGRGPDLTQWLEDAQINRDRNMRLEYLAGMALNSYIEDDIYRDMLRYRRYPDSLFITSDAVERTLKEAMTPQE